MSALELSRRILARSRSLALGAAARTGILGLAGTRLAGMGVIYMLHRVCAPGEPNLYPGYRISTAELDATLRAVKHSRVDVIPMDEVEERLSRPASGRRFVCFTFDDGYLDNLTLALPIFQKHAFPFTVHVTTEMVERTTVYWWGATEELLKKADSVRFEVPGERSPRTLPARTLAEKRAAFGTLDALCHTHGLPFYETLCKQFCAHGISAQACLERDVLNVEQLRKLAAEPLVTIGSHCLSHRVLATLSDEELDRELLESRKRLEGWLDRPIHHMAYPFGTAAACSPREFTAARKAGYRSAVTSRRGNIFPGHRYFMQCLPRRCVPHDRAQVRNTLTGVESLLRSEPVFQTN